MQENAVLQSAEQLVAGAVLGVAYGAGVGGLLPVILHGLGILKSTYPPDPVPGYEFEDNEALQPRGSPRRAVSSISAGTVRLTSRK